MLDGFAFPFVSATKLRSTIQRFASCFAKATQDKYLKELINHPTLQEEEKCLWVWLAAQCANEMSFSCSYGQISRALNKPPRLIHRYLFRLLINGFLIAEIPIFYGEPPPEMVQKVRTIKLTAPYRSPLVQKEDNALVLKRRLT